MTEQITRYESIEKTLERIYKDNDLEKKDELPLDDPFRSMFLMPNGDYLLAKVGHTATLLDYLEPNQNYQDFIRKSGLIHMLWDRKDNNRLDFVILSPISKAQLKTVYRTYKDIPDLRITYDVVDLDKPFSINGEGYREMLADLREKNYLPKE